MRALWAILVAAALASACNSTGTTLSSGGSGSSSGSGGSGNSGNTPVATHEVQVSWTAASGVIEGYNVEQSTDGQNFSVVATVGSSATSVNVTGLQGSTTYYFRVQAYNEAGGSAYSGAVTALTP